MKGDEKLLDALNELLADELTAISQYMVHSEMCDNWGYDRLHGKVEARAVEEMKHAEKLIARILFLEGTPVVSKLREMHIGAAVPDQLANDLSAELDAVRTYNAAIKVAGDASDFATREMLESILQDEDRHLDWLEEQHDQIEQMGVQIYLSTQAG